MILEYWKNSRIQTLNVDNSGRIGRNARVAFMTGHCHSLAAALHKLTDWPIYGFISKETEDTRYSPSHITVKHPSKRYFDIEGFKALERWKEVYPNTRVSRLELDEVLYKLDCFLPIQIEKATPFAETLLKKIL